MSGGINFDEEKRRQQFMSMQAQRNLETSGNQNFDYSTRRKKQTNYKDLLITIGIVFVVLLLLIFFMGS